MSEAAGNGVTDRGTAGDPQASPRRPSTRPGSNRRGHGRIFLSYRRDDTSGYAGRLSDDLTERFGASRVFRDIETIGAGSDFVEVIEESLESCRALVAVIGREWLTCADTDGRRRLDDPADVLRLELVTALERGILVVPVLVEEATLPSADDLPEQLQALVRRNAVEISDTRWDHDVDRLVAVLQTVVRPAGRGVTARRAVAGVLSVTTLLATVLGVYWGLVPFFRRTPELGPMHGGVNIAVARFPELRPDGRVVTSAAGDALASQLFDQLDNELRPLNDAGFAVERRSPKDTKVVEGATREERAASAARLADRINADLVVYGVIQSEPSGTGFSPEFYVSEQRLGGKAEELAGQHELGAKVGANGDLSNPVVSKLLRDRLLGRIQAMTQFAIALGYYRVDGHYGEALQHLEAAGAAQGWDEADGKEVLYLFLGNAAQKIGDLPRAESAYQRAVAINPEYARGRLGVAEMMFQRAKGTCEAGDADGAALDRAVSAFRAALDAKDQPAYSDVPVKSDLGVARVYVCQSQALLADRWKDAAASFGRVVAAYEGGNQRVRQQAAEAYGGLGLVELPFAGDTDATVAFRRSAAAYRKAIETSEQADRTAAFYAMLGFVHRQLGEKAAADAAYAEAIKLAPDPDVRRGY